MICSMTGYGEVQRALDGVRFTMEMRSVNNRYFKSVLKVPDGFQALESQVEKLLRTRVARGSVTTNLRIRNATATAAYEVNHEALSRYARSLSDVTLPNGMEATIDLATLSGLPGVCQMPEVDEAERNAQCQLVIDMVGQCLDQLVVMRQREGRALHDDLLVHCSGLRDALNRVADRAPVVLQEYHERLANRVGTLVSEAKLALESETLSREVALFADRCDISEEIARLRAHVDHFIEMCDAGESVGRKLDFLAQEMLREVNTVGSKSSDAQIARAVVEMKALVDRIKEQVQNAE